MFNVIDLFSFIFVISFIHFLSQSPSLFSILNQLSKTHSSQSPRISKHIYWTIPITFMSHISYISHFLALFFYFVLSYPLFSSSINHTHHFSIPNTSITITITTIRYILAALLILTLYFIALFELNWILSLIHHIHQVVNVLLFPFHILCCTNYQLRD